MRHTADVAAAVVLVVAAIDKLVACHYAHRELRRCDCDCSGCVQSYRELTDTGATTTLSVASPPMQLLTPF